MVGGNKNMSKENTAVTKKKIKRCKEDVVFDAACFIILTLVLFVVAYPLYWVIISSISAPSAVSSGKVLLHPIGFTLKGYAEVFKNDQVMRGFLNSLIITFCGVMVNLIVTLPTSYALSRCNFSGKKPRTIFSLIKGQTRIVLKLLHGNLRPVCQRMSAPQIDICLALEKLDKFQAILLKNLPHDLFIIVIQIKHTQFTLKKLDIFNHFPGPGLMDRKLIFIHANLRYHLHKGLDRKGIVLHGDAEFLF